jgi:NADH:ubiquinone oxidoreductase subunit 2 (subunit N)
MDISSLASSLDSISASLPLLGTELALTALLLVVLVVHLITRRRWPAFTGYVTIGGLLIVTVFWFSQTLGLDSYTLSARPWALMGGALELDRWAQWFKGLVLGGTLVGVLLTRSEARPVAGETYFLLVALALGGVLMAGANHGLIVYLGIELASLASYVLVALSKGDTLSERLRAEAATKYIVYGAVSSALMLYGFSLVYGLTGTLQLGSGLALRLADADPAAATVAVSFVLIGLAYKLSAAPMHFWSPDVYEAAPGGVVAALATTSKLAALAIVLRLTDSVATVPTWPLLVAGLALLSLTVGSLGALAQRDAAPAVWVVGAGNALELRPVQVRQYREDAVLLDGGLAPGEMIVAAGVHKLRAGQVVFLGSVTPPIWIEGPTGVLVEFDTLGRVELRFI